MILDIDRIFDRANLEHDLKSTEWLCTKVRDDHRYAQNLYAALCNNDFQKQTVIGILRGDRWSCSWRYAGGIVADICDQGGDYLDFYCSGAMGGDPDSYETMSRGGWVSEGGVTDAVRRDLAAIKWRILDDQN